MSPYQVLLVVSCAGFFMAWVLHLRAVGKLQKVIEKRDRQIHDIAGIRNRFVGIIITSIEESFKVDSVQALTMRRTLEDELVEMVGPICYYDPPFARDFVATFRHSAMYRSGPSSGEVNEYFGRLADRLEAAIPAEE